MTASKEKLFAGLGGEHRIYTIAFVVLILAGAALRIANLGNVVTRSPDERTYAWESSEIADHGEEGFRFLVDQFQRNPQLFTWPSPARAGYLWLLSWMDSVSGHHDPLAGATLSCIASIGTLFLIGVTGWRFLNPQVALAAMLFYAVSPPVLAMARRSWQESFVELLTLLLFFTALGVVKEKTSWSWSIVFGFLIAFSITVKEIAFFDAVLVLTLVGVVLLRRGDFKRLSMLAGSTAVWLALTCLWLGHELGSFSTFTAFIRQGVTVAGSSEYAIVWQSGSVFSWFSSLWVCDPLTFTLGVIGLVAVICLAVKNGLTAERYLLWGASSIVLVFLLLPVGSPHHFNLRFACPIFAPLCLLAGVAVQTITMAIGHYLDGAERRWIRRFAFAVLLCAAFINYRGFQERFVRTDLQDLSLKMIQGDSDRP